MLEKHIPIASKRLWGKNVKTFTYRGILYNDAQCYHIKVDHECKWRGLHLQHKYEDAN